MPSNELIPDCVSNFIPNKYRTSPILIVEDERALSDAIAQLLKDQHYEVDCVYDGRSGLDYARSGQYDLIILDVMMPGISGVETLQRIREKWRTPVLMLTARGDPVDRILGLELGADDYVPKPCSPRELVARIRAILRRVAGNENNRGPVQVGKLSIDLTQRRATYDGKQIPLTGTELSLLEMLARSAGSPVPKADIYPRILGRPMGRYDRAIDVHISAIRHKLAQEGVEDIAIESVRGVGYQLVRLS